MLNKEKIVEIVGGLVVDKKNGLSKLDVDFYVSEIMEKLNDEYVMREIIENVFWKIFEKGK